MAKLRWWASFQGGKSVLVHRPISKLYILSGEANQIRSFEKISPRVARAGRRVARCRLLSHHIFAVSCRRVKFHIAVHGYSCSYTPLQLEPGHRSAPPLDAIILHRTPFDRSFATTFRLPGIYAYPTTVSPIYTSLQCFPVAST